MCVSQQKLRPCRYLVDLQNSVHLAAFVFLLLHLLREAFTLALHDGVGALEGPASTPVCLAYIVAAIAASARNPPLLSGFFLSIKVSVEGAEMPAFC